MSHFTLKQDGFTSHTSIPNCFIEQFMPYAAGEFVKIYIYLLKCVNENRSELSISRIADVFNNTEKDVVRALKYWQRKGLLKLTFDDNNALASLCIVSLTDDLKDPVEEPESGRVTLNVTDAPVPGQPGITAKHIRTAPVQTTAVAEPVSGAEMDRTQEPVPRKEAGSIQENNPVQEMDLLQEAVPEEDPAVPVIPDKREYSRAEILAFSSQEEMIQLFYIIQKYLGRSLTGQDTNTVLYLYDTLQFPAELIEYLFEYCVSRNHRSIRYIEKTALGWAEQGIRSVKAARMMAGIYSDHCYHVMSAFGLNHRKPTRNESDYVSRWELSYGFDLNLILAACGRTMDHLHQPNFEYTDAILKRWKSNGVTSMEDVRRLDEAFEQAAGRKEKRDKTSVPKASPAASQFNNFRQRNYDYSLLEQKLIRQSGNQ